MVRRKTATSNFGAGRRESHDARGFYARFTPPTVSDDDHVAPRRTVADPFVCADARAMTDLADSSVALVVTSPPYFAGKAYEEELTRSGVPSSYLEFLALLRDVFAECTRVLEPGGRIAVNVANLGRKPYRSLAADVTRILQDDLHLLLRGEVVWRKGDGASGNCAWGSFRSPANPTLRDTTERIVIASKGRFDRARTIAQRAREGLAHLPTIGADEFMAATLDVWTLPPERAGRVGHPAPFPTTLPERLIRLYTYADDLVLDPFMGSGSTMVAAARTGRRFVGYDTDPAYVEIARRRVEAEGSVVGAGGGGVPLDDGALRDALPLDYGGPRDALPLDDADTVTDVALRTLTNAGMVIERTKVKVARTGITLAALAGDGDGRTWPVDISGAFTVEANGLARLETVWRAIGRAATLVGRGHRPVVHLSSHLPAHAGEADAALAAAPAGLFSFIGRAGSSEAELAMKALLAERR